jgi:excisionase family DNA binding protein
MTDADSDTPAAGLRALAGLRRPRLLRLSEAAKHLPVSERTAWRWAADGRLPTTEVGGRRYVSVEALEKLLLGVTPDVRRSAS